MNWQQIVINSYENVTRILTRTLDGLTIDDLHKQPEPDCNSMGWLTWHLTRWQDRTIAELIGEEQLWVRDEWCKKFNRPPDPADTGWGHSPEDVKAFQSPDMQTLLDYHRAVSERTLSYISNLSEDDLNRDLGNERTVGSRLTGTLGDSLQHAGQVAYLRGLLKD